MKKIVFFNAEDQQDLSVEQEMVEGMEIQLELCNDRPDEALAEVCRDADAVITIYSTVDAKALSALTSCQVVAVQAIGFNNLDLKAASELGICLANVPDFCLYDVALHTAALTLACSRHLIQLDRQVKGGKWGYAGHVMNRLSGQTFGMIAFGNIPRTLAPMLKTFGMKLITYAPHVSDNVLEQYGVCRAESLEELLTASDFVSVHCPLRPQNVDLIGARELSCMKPTAFLINTARGRIVNEAALYTALKAGQIAGAALDVLEAERDGDNPLYHLDSVIVTPHTAFYSQQSMLDMRVKAMEQVLAVLQEGRAPENLLNPEALPHARFLR